MNSRVSVARQKLFDLRKKYCTVREDTKKIESSDDSDFDISDTSLDNEVKIPDTSGTPKTLNEVYPHKKEDHGVTSVNSESKGFINSEKNLLPIVTTVSEENTNNFDSMNLKKSPTSFFSSVNNCTEKNESESLHSIKSLSIIEDTHSSIAEDISDEEKIIESLQSHPLANIHLVSDELLEDVVTISTNRTENIEERLLTFRSSPRSVKSLQLSSPIKPPDLGQKIVEYFSDFESTLSDSSDKDLNYEENSGSITDTEESVNKSIEGYKQSIRSARSLAKFSNQSINNIKYSPTSKSSKPKGSFAKPDNIHDSSRVTISSWKTPSQTQSITRDNSSVSDVSDEPLEDSIKTIANDSEDSNSESSVAALSEKSDITNNSSDKSKNKSHRLHYSNRSSNSSIQSNSKLNRNYNLGESAQKSSRTEMTGQISVPTSNKSTPLPSSRIVLSDDVKQSEIRIDIKNKQVLESNSLETELKDKKYHKHSNKVNKQYHKTIYSNKSCELKKESNDIVKHDKTKQRFKKIKARTKIVKNKNIQCNLYSQKYTSDIDDDLTHRPKQKGFIDRSDVDLFRSSGTETFYRRFHNRPVFISTAVQDSEYRPTLKSTKLYASWNMENYTDDDMNDHEIKDFDESSTNVLDVMMRNQIHLIKHFVKSHHNLYTACCRTVRNLNEDYKNNSKVYYSGSIAYRK